MGEVAQASTMRAMMETLLNRTQTPEYPFSSKQNLFEFDVHTSGLLTQLLIECISSVGSFSKSQQIPPLIRDIRSYLTAHYNEKITLGFLSAQFNLDPYYLQKLFKRYVGQSPTEYLIYLRMTRAKSLMRTSTMSISEIAYTVGIDNISHFTRLFKKQEGATPGQYRKAWPIA